MRHPLAGLIASACDLSVVKSSPVNLPVLLITLVCMGAFQSVHLSLLTPLQPAACHRAWLQ